MMLKKDKWKNEILENIFSKLYNHFRCYINMRYIGIAFL